jgi:FixJ family two-component response regulator
MSGRIGLLKRLGQRPVASIGNLSPRERDVLAAVVRGLTNKEIGVELGISHRTVEIHRARLMRKLGVSSLADLLAIALRDPTDLQSDRLRPRVAP